MLLNSKLDKILYAGIIYARSVDNSATVSKLQEILRRYKELCGYCDGFWDRVFNKFPDAFACAPGCSTCCELPSVNYLEAFIIAGKTRNNKIIRAAAGAGGPCPFLDNDRRSIYQSRPLICRTHGLLLKSEEYSYSMTISCPFNFTDTDLDTIDPSLVLEIDTVSNNLARLNAAFCLLHGGSVKKAGERIPLRDLASGKVTSDFFTNKERKK